MDNETLKALRTACKGKRAKFAEEFVIDRNRTAAAIRAGIPEKGVAVQGSRFLMEPEVRAYVDALIEAEAEAIGVNRESLIAKSERIYRRCMQQEPKHRYNKESGEWEETGEYEFDARGAAKALELQAKLVGVLTEKRELSTAESFSVHISTVEDDETV